MDWFKTNKKKIGDIITTRIHEVLKTGVKVSIDKEKELIVTIKKVDLAKDSSAARPEVFSSGNALDAKITELDIKNRKIKLSVKAAQIDEEKSLIAKFGDVIKDNNQQALSIQFGCSAVYDGKETSRTFNLTIEIGLNLNIKTE